MGIRHRRTVGEYGSLQPQRLEHPRSKLLLVGAPGGSLDDHTQHNVVGVGVLVASSWLEGEWLGGDEGDYPLRRQILARTEGLDELLVLGVVRQAACVPEEVAHGDRVALGE